MGSRCAHLVLLALVGAPWVPASVDAATCAGTATVSVYVDNQSDDDDLTIQVRGQLLDATSTCSGLGTTSYQTTLTCAGQGTQFCGVVRGLRPGAWAHTIITTVPGSEQQRQSRRQALVGSATGGSNVVEWTVYPRTFVVGAASDDEFIADLTAAEAYTAANPGRFALLTFSRTTFPGAAAPVSIPLGFVPQSDTADHCDASVQCGTPSRATRVCLDGSRVVVDALDDRGQPGAVALSVGRCATSLMRIVGSGNVLRGLRLIGSAKPNPDPDRALDTIAVSGGAARGNRLESVILHGPTLGDGISVEGPNGSGAADVTVVDTIIMGAEDKGVKVRDGSQVTITDSCLHDNRNGGVQATFGGNARVERSVVQFNVPGGAENGLSAGVPEDVANQNTLETDGNIIRFAGSRGISVVNNADAVLENDFVAENQDAGLVLETTAGGVQPAASARGLTLACNRAEISRTCMAQSISCVQHSDCVSSCGSASPDGFGVVVRQCETCMAPLTDFGPTGNDPGRNAITFNPRFGGNGINFRNALVGNPPATIMARGNQWERCLNPPLSGNRCDGTAIAAGDVRPTASVDAGSPTLPYAGPNPIVVDIQPRRPRKGDMVRVYNGVLSGHGGPFNAVDGIACRAGGIDGPSGLPLGLPADRCDVRSAEIAQANHDLARGMKVELTVGDDKFAATAIDVHAVTPSMLVFQMPVDCHSAGTLTVSRGTDKAATVAICDVQDCIGREEGALCDDGNACTVEDRCDGAGACVSGGALVCDRACDTGTCNPTSGCVRTPAGGDCDDGDQCTVGDSCTAAGACVAGVSRSCDGECLTGVCEPQVGCVPRPVNAVCDDGNACTVDDRCDSDGVCDSGAPLECDDLCDTGTCNPAFGCVRTPAGGACEDGNQCTVGDSCTAGGVCVTGAPRSCEAECLTGECQPSVGCLAHPATTTCDDDDACTQDDRCSGVDERCLGGIGVLCEDDEDPCTLPICDAEVGCTTEPALDGTECPASDACHGPPSCIDGGCDPGPAIACEDGDQCTNDQCDPAGGCFATPLPAFDSVLCRISEMRGLVDGASGLPRKMARKLRKKIDMVDGAVMRANSTNKPARAERMLERAGKAVVKLAATLHRAGKSLDPTLEQALRRSVEDARATITVLRADA